ncbi:SMI1/KNR4 family protein [Tenacibaculum sp. MEBiC06402]|uniref:SMI1/KNR4 family protein n=1 Tax=unclassified Tenacibaculum TaxID=2635139 RepID=UPI003B9B9BB5
MENLKYFWGRKYTHSTCEPLTDKMIEIAENHFKVKLPYEYLNLLRFRNGGFLRFNSHPKIDWYDGLILGIGQSDNSIFNTDWDNYYITDEKGEEISFPKDSDKLIQLNDSSNAIICLDYRNTDEFSKEPKISVINPQLESDYVIASSFKEFLSDLKYDSPYYEFVIESNSYSDQELISLIETSFGVQFEDLRNDPSFKALRGKIISSDYKETTTVDPEYGFTMTKVVGKSDLVWLAFNVEEDGFVNYPTHENVRWIFKIGNSVLTKTEILNKMKEIPLKAILVFDLEPTAG